MNLASFTSLPLMLLAEVEPTTAPSATSTASSSGLVFWLVMLAGMALAPFVLTMVTSFAKLVIVGGIVRHALGTQQIPPNTVITGLALILTVHIMSPVGMRMYAHFQQNAPAEENPTTGQVIRRVAVAAEGPMREFLLQHSHPQNIALFEDLHERLRQSSRDADTDKAEADLSKDALLNDAMRDATVLTPAFMLSQLTEAFQIGFLLFVPFLIIDLVVSNVLMAMGMQMMSPVTVSMPLKLLLFVLIDGWTLVMRGLVLSYT